MPVMQGNKLATSIKLVAPSLPILMITASESARRDATNPVDELLNKPFSVIELHRALEKVLSARPEPVEPEFVPALECPSVSFVSTDALLPA
jgi:CheY-like chemotaxis protein